MIAVSDTPQRRAGDAELSRIRDTLQSLLHRFESLVTEQIRTSSLMQHLQAMVQDSKTTLEQTRVKVEGLPVLDRRVWLLERIVFGVTATMLLAVIAALMSLLLREWSNQGGG